MSYLVNPYIFEQPPVWVTASGSLGSGYTTKSYSFTVTATNATSYSLQSGSLPGGMSINAGTGAISGTISGISDYVANQVYSFSIRASRGGLFSDRSFSIIGSSIFVGRTCATAGEGGTASAGVPGGFVIKRIDFLSYGTPNGGCGSFTFGGCHTGTTSNLNDRLGTTSFSRPATNGYWGDPCGGTLKRLYIQVSHGPA
jgi:hypothetical protein